MSFRKQQYQHKVVCGRGWGGNPGPPLLPHKGSLEEGGLLPEWLAPSSRNEKFKSRSKALCQCLPVLWPAESKNFLGFHTISKLIIPSERKTRSGRWCMKEEHFYRLAFSSLQKFNDLRTQIQQPARWRYVNNYWQVKVSVAWMDME